MSTRPRTPPSRTAGPSRARRSPCGCAGRCRRGLRPRPASRSATSGRSARRTAPCNDRPVANSRWMTVSCRSRAMRSRSSRSVSSPHPGVQTGVLDGDAGGAGQGDHELLVDVAEHLGRCLVGQVQVAEDLVADPHGHAEERPHRRVVRREPVRVGMLLQVGETDRLRVDDEQPEDAVALGQVADRPVRARRRGRRSGTPRAPSWSRRGRRGRRSGRRRARRRPRRCAAARSRDRGRR